MTQSCYKYLNFTLMSFKMTNYSVLKKSNEKKKPYKYQ